MAALNGQLFMRVSSLKFSSLEAINHCPPTLALCLVIIPHSFDYEAKAGPK